MPVGGINPSQPSFSSHGPQGPRGEGARFTAPTPTSTDEFKKDMANLELPIDSSSPKGRDAFLEISNFMLTDDFTKLSPEKRRALHDQFKKLADDIIWNKDEKKVQEDFKAIKELATTL